jgi:hypothetical protein
MEKPSDFVLKAHDYLTPDIINAWITKAVLLGVNKDKLEKARKHKEDVLRWQDENMQEVKIPD